MRQKAFNYSSWVHSKLIWAFFLGSIWRLTESCKVISALFGNFWKLPSNFGSAHARRKPTRKGSIPNAQILNDRNLFELATVDNGPRVMRFDYVVFSNTFLQITFEQRKLRGWFKRDRSKRIQTYTLWIARLRSKCDLRLKSREVTWWFEVMLSAP